MGIEIILRTLATECRERTIDFLLVGGWALNAYGVARQTLGFDILIHDVDLSEIESILTRNTYDRVYSTELFAKFRSQDTNFMDIDCLLTDSITIHNMLQEAQAIQIADASFLIPGHRHMVAMKLHASKHNPKRRHGRDMTDIIEMVRVNEIDARDESF